MFSAIAKSLFGSANDRYVNGLRKNVDAINGLEAELSALPDDGLKTRTEEFRKRLANGENHDDLLVEAFATVREASKRTLGLRHFDVQMLGGIVLHRGQIAEMKTGEGKTLVATLAVYLNAIEGKGVHVVTVNDYLAQRDAGWMEPVYNILGLTVGVIKHGMDDADRRTAYNCDITYATNNELGFDYLRDNMKFSLDDMVQRPFNYAIVDEVDSILIDEARTPLIISGATEDNSDLYVALDKVVRNVTPEDYEKDEKARAVTFTEDGMEKLEEMLRERGLMEEGSLYDINNISLVHHANSALRAHVLFQRDTDYIVKDGKVVIIDEFTGRMMEGRRYSEGLHQALEAKEGVEIQNENQTLASITFQNYFRLYPKLAGMTGTAMTEAGEFAQIYSLEVIEIPTNVPCIRKDEDDIVFRTGVEKYEAIIDLIEECHKRQQPVLVGTVSIEKSEDLAAQLKKRKIPHNVLNARYHEQEAHIIAQAGQPGAVTIATNMAGRGTDIKMGGNLEMRAEQEINAEPGTPEYAQQLAAIEAEIEKNREIVTQAGGLYVIATERHESRRIDNQLRGRSGRQGDPGASSFFLSLEDDLMRIFGSERIDGMLQKLGLQEGEAIVHPWVNKALEKAQQKVEERNFEIRKNLLKFDDVMNDQRKVIYEQRKELMSAEDVSEDVTDMRHQVIDDLVSLCMPKKAYAEQWEMDTLHEEIMRIFGLDLPVQDWAKEEGIAEAEIHERLIHAVDAQIAAKAANAGPEIFRSVEKAVLLQLLDQLWKDHLLTLDHLRHGIGLRAYGQRDPLNEYKQEAFGLFESMLIALRERTTLMLAHVELNMEFSEEEYLAQHGGAEGEAHHDSPEYYGGEGGDEGGNATMTVVNRQAATEVDPNDQATWGKVPRNAPCPCGSGKKFKHCHGQVA